MREHQRYPRWWSMSYSMSLASELTTEKFRRLVGLRRMTLTPAYLECDDADYEAPVLCATDAEMEALVVLFGHQRVSRPRRCRDVAPELVRAVRFVHAGVEDGGVVVRPGRSVGDVFDLVLRAPGPVERSLNRSLKRSSPGVSYA